MFRGYLQLFHDHVYYRRIYRRGVENLPPVGTPLLVTCNHQNSLNDPLALELKLGPRVVSIFARADVFNRPMVAAFLRALYILPAYRMRDGEETLTQNYVAFSEAAEQMNRGNSVAIFPEAMNQTCHWLGEFSMGYLRMVFGAAEANGFQQDILILPVAMHYENYYHMQADLVITYAEPIHLKDYYELYRTKPRTVQREINKLVRQRIEENMLDIRDLSNYEAIDYLRESYGTVFAAYRAKNPEILSDKLDADRELVAVLDRAKEIEPKEIEEIYASALELKKQTRRLGVRDWNFDKAWSWFGMFGRGLGLLLLLPLFLFALVPNIIIYFAPEKLVRKFQAMGGTFVMFVGGLRFITTALFSAPLCYLLTFVADGCLLGWNYWWIALLHLCALPWLGLFAWRYRIRVLKWWSEIRLHHQEVKAQEVRELRKLLWDRLDKIVKVE